jgi:hypothetical protein
VRSSEITEVLSRPVRRELLARDITRLAYTAKDGTPRNADRFYLAWLLLGHVHS